MPQNLPLELVFRILDYCVSDTLDNLDCADPPQPNWKEDASPPPPPRPLHLLPLILTSRQFYEYLRKHPVLERIYIYLPICKRRTNIFALDIADKQHYVYVYLVKTESRVNGFAQRNSVPSYCESMTLDPSAPRELRIRTFSDYLKALLEFCAQIRVRRFDLHIRGDSLRHLVLSNQECCQSTRVVLDGEGGKLILEWNAKRDKHDDEEE